MGVKGRDPMRARDRRYERDVANEKTDVWEVRHPISGAKLAVVTAQSKALQWERDGYAVRHVGIWTRSAALNAARRAA